MPSQLDVHPTLRSAVPSRADKKLIIQIPCYNEAEQIENCLAGLPAQVSGFDRVETMVIDDGSSDDTVQRARAAGADHVFRLGSHRGLAFAFLEGIQHAFQNLEADVVVNYDADMQYDARDIPSLTAPILSQQADFVLGQRPIPHMMHFSPSKRLFQKLGSAFVSFMCDYSIPDATTGFRALSRDTGLRLSVWTHYSYTLETLIHARELDLRLLSVPIRVLPRATRPSKLVRSNLQYCWTSFQSILLTVIRYRPLVTFMILGALALSGSLALGIRYLWYFMHGYDGKTQSLILCAILAIAAFSSFLTAILGESIALNRRLLEDLRYESRKRNYARADR